VDSKSTFCFLNKKLRKITKEFEMKKSLIAVLVAAVLVASFGVVSSVYAYGGNPAVGNDSAVRQQLKTEDGLGLYHDEILTAFSEALGIPVEDLETRIDAGETIIEIAVAEGMSLEDAQALLPVGKFAGRSADWKGRGFMASGDNAEFAPRGQYSGDGTCLVDGEVVPQNLQQGMGW
jgi:cell division protein FtsL